MFYLKVILDFFFGHPGSERDLPHEENAKRFTLMTHFVLYRASDRGHAFISQLRKGCATIGKTYFGELSQCIPSQKNNLNDRYCYC